MAYWDKYNWRSLTQAVKQIQIPEDFYLVNTFIPQNSWQGFPIEPIEWDVLTTSHKMAPVAVRGDEPVRMTLQESIKRMQIVPPQIYLSVPVHVDIAWRLRPEYVMDWYITAESEATKPFRFLEEYLGRVGKELKNMVIRRLEWMTAKILQEGKIEVVDYRNRTLSYDFGVPASNFVTPSVTWDDTTNADPIKDLQGWVRQFAANCGEAPDVIIMGSEAAEAFLNHPKVRDVIISFGGASIIKVFYGGDVKGKTARPIADVAGVGVIHEYWGKYQDDNGNAQNYIDPKKVIFVKKDTFACYYTGIMRYDLQKVVVEPFLVDRIQKDGGKVVEITLESHIIPLIRDARKMMVATVL